MRNIGFIGLGRMGMPMAANLVKAGFRVIGHDLASARMTKFAALGAEIADNPAQVASRSDITVSMIMNDAILHEVALGEAGVLAGAGPGHIYVDLSTVSPGASSEVGARAKAVGVGYLCAKVAGSVGLAQTASLTLFASGETADFETCKPALSAMAAKVHHVGKGDSAAYLTLVHSLIVGVYSSMIGEALTFGQRGGLTLETMLDILEAGPLGSRQLTLKTPMLKARSFNNPPSDIDTAAKDIDLILDTARSDQTPLPLTAIARQMMANAQAHGDGKQEIYSILEVFERLAGIQGGGHA